MSRNAFLSLIITLFSNMLIAVTINEPSIEPNQSNGTYEETIINYDSTNASSFITSNTLKNGDNMTASIQFGSFLLDNYTFKVIHSNETSIKIGFGIRPNYSNDLLAILKQHNYIESQIVYYSTYPKPSIQFPIDKRKDEAKNFTYCDLTERKDLDEKYHSSWICDYSHIKPQDAKYLNESIEINGRAVFDTSSKYIIAPIEFINIIQDYFDLKGKCDLFVDDDSNNVDLHCNLTQSDIDSMDEISFLFDGIAYAIPGRSLFIETQGELLTYYSSLIVFRKEKKNLWLFGYPFLSAYQMELDFDSKEIGFKGYAAYDMTAQWEEWRNSKISFINKVYNDKLMMGIGIFLGSAILIIVLVVIIRAFRKRSGGVVHSEFIEEKNKA